MSESGSPPGEGVEPHLSTTTSGPLGTGAPDPIIDLRASDARVSTNREPTPPPVTTSGSAATPSPSDPADASASDPSASDPAPSGVSPSDVPPSVLASPVVASSAASNGDPQRAGDATSGLGGHRLARTVFATFVPLLAVLLVTAVAAFGISTASSAEARRGERIARASVREHQVQLASDDLWAGVLGLVSSGVGEQVTDPDDVLTLVGTARSDPPGPVPDGVSGSAVQQATAQSHREFVDSVDAALDTAAGDPIDLGNELGDLAELHAAARKDSIAWTDTLWVAASESMSSADDLRTAALAVGVIGLLVAALIAFATWRRLATVLDGPAKVIGDTLHRFAGGEIGTRVRPRDRAGLAALAYSVDRDLDAVSGQFMRLRSRAEWGEQSRMIFEALDQAEDEPAAHDVIRRALGMLDARHHPVELLLADRGSTRLLEVASDNTIEGPGCPVDSTGACVALRRGQVAVFDSSESINACPKLRDRPSGPISAVCVPVTVATRPVGVFHMTGPEFSPPETQVAERLVTLSVQVGNRLSALRTLESTRKEASTDGLTGLPNRRLLESEVATLLERGTPFVMVLADLDKFKKLNDNFGHEIGDKALQLFSAVLRDNVRGNDVVSRIGGEEFVLVYPNMSVEISIEAIGRLRQALARAVAAARLPPFTCSFGVTHSEVGADGDTILRVADAGLLRAKELGGDQAVFADEELAAAVFNNGGGPGASGTTRGARAQSQAGRATNDAVDDSSQADDTSQVDDAGAVDDSGQADPGQEHDGNDR